MLKIRILGIALAAFALSGTMVAASAETIPADEITSSASVSGEPLGGPHPEVRISHLPEIGETAVVTVTYTYDGLVNITEATVQTYPTAYSTGWKVSPGFEIVNSGNMTTEPYYVPGESELGYHYYSTLTPLNTGESVTYTFEVRAVGEGHNYVAGVGYRQIDVAIFMYLDDEETLSHAEHSELYPNLHRAHPEMSKSEREQAVEAETRRLLAEAIKNPRQSDWYPLVGDELIEAVTTWVVREGFTPEETVKRLAPHATLNVDDIRRILTGTGFSEDEINSALSTSWTYAACPDGRVPMASPSGATICVFEKSVLKLENRGFVHTGEPFDMFPVKAASASGTQSVGQITRPPTISMSDLPEIGETAIVEITYTNRLADITAAEFAANPKIFAIGWTVGYGLEVANDYGNTPEKVSYLDGSPAFIFREPVHLAYNESKTYRVEVRAVDEGKGHVAGVGYSSSKGISLYLDDNETLPFQEHKDRYPAQHLRAPTPPEPFPREEVEYEPPSRELLADFFVAYFANEETDDATVHEAMDFVQRVGYHLNYTLPDLKEILGAADYTDKEIEAEWSSRASTQSFSQTQDHISIHQRNHS